MRRATMDKAHQQTDKLLERIKRELRKQYQKLYNEIKREANETLLKIELDKKATPQQRYAEAQKYDRLDKLADSLATKIAEVNSIAIKLINASASEIYQLNYNETLKYLPDDLVAEIKNATKKESNEEAKANKSPYDEIATDRLKDKENIKRDIKSKLVNGILQGALIGAIVSGVKASVERQLESTSTMATTNTTRIESIGIYDAGIGVAKKISEQQGKGYKVYKTWMSVRDSKTRDAHSVANRQKVEINDAFTVGGESLSYPGWEGGSPGNIINCRCTMQITAEKDD